MSESAEESSPFIVVWRDDLSIGISKIDGEHQHLFDLFNRLSVATVAATMGELEDYVVEHFAGEHRLMEDGKYPALAEHLEQHEQLATSLAGFIVAGDEWTVGRVRDLQYFLSTWLMGHIPAHDLRLAEWYRARNATDAPKVALNN